MATAAQSPIVNSADLSASGRSDLFQDSPPASAKNPQQLSGQASVLPRQKRGQGYPVPNVRVEILPPAYAPDPRPSKILFGGLQDPGLQLQRAIPLEVCVDESSVVVRWVEIEEFGTGETLSDALDDFAHTVRELYHHLHADHVKPGTDLLRVMKVLGEYVEPRPK
jgi:hypothetical protein